MKCRGKEKELAKYVWLQLLWVVQILKSKYYDKQQKENGPEVFEMGNGDQYLAQFTTNSIESMNAELKRCVDSKLLIDYFINKLKMIVDV